MPMTNPQSVEEYARERGIPALFVTTHELLGVASGHPLVTSTEDGQRVVLRLPNHDEYVAEVRRAHEQLRAMGATPPPMPTADEIERLIRPLSLSLRF